MDERKRSSRLILRYTLTALALTLISLIAYSAWVNQWIQSRPNPRSCFTTTMFRLKLCPKDLNYLKYDQIPDHLIQALVQSEDGNFFYHQGFDWYEIKESFLRNLQEGRIARGGSTITQQLAKNLYLSPSKNILRKINEFLLARMLEEKLSKKEILEKYLNIVEFGEGIFGLKQAAFFYFSKQPRSLNLMEAVYLVSLLPSPKKLGQSHKDRQLSKSNIWRMETILRRLYKSKKIADELYVYAKMQIETEGWPFPSFTPPTLWDQDFNAEDEILEEMEDLESSDEEPDTTEELSDVESSVENSEL